MIGYDAREWMVWKSKSNTSIYKQKNKKTSTIECFPASSFKKMKAWHDWVTILLTPAAKISQTTQHRGTFQILNIKIVFQGTRKNQKW